MTIELDLSEPFRWERHAGGRALVCDALLPAPHAFTTREWALGSAAVDGHGWADVAEAVGAVRLVRARQVHGATSLVVRGDSPPADRGAGLPEADIVLSDDPAVAIAVQTADCVPLLALDRRTGTVAAAHAGWRGLAARVPAATLDALSQRFGSRPADLTVVVGPSIGACCYEVGEDVRRRFVEGDFEPADVERWFKRADREGRWFLDMWTVARDQLIMAGVAAGAVHVARVCTASHPEVLCSYRRDGGGAGRMAAVIRAIPPGPSRRSPGDRHPR